MKKYQNHLLNIVIILTLCAIGLHFYLTQKYFALQFGNLTESSACNINTLFNCDITSASKYAALGGIPMALWGAISNIIFLLFALIVRFRLSSDEENVTRWTFLGAALIALVSIIMGVLSATMIRSVCLFCILTYVISFINFAAIWIITEGKSLLSRQIRTLATTDRWVLGMIATVPVTAFLLNPVFSGQYGLGKTKIHILAAEKVQYWKLAPQNTFDLQKGLIKGDTNNPRLIIVEFADFLCPHCKFASPTLEAFTLSRPGVLLVFKPFPLDGTCNPDPVLKGHGDGNRCYLSSLVMCEEKLNKNGWAAHHFVFDNQEKLREWGSNETIAQKWCENSQSDCQQLINCISSEETRKEISEMAEEGIKAQVQGTPTIFANGKLLQGGQLIPVLNMALENVGN